MFSIANTECSERPYNSATYDSFEYDIISYENGDLGIRGYKVSNQEFRAILSETAYQKFPIFCMVLERKIGDVISGRNVNFGI